VNFSTKHQKDGFGLSILKKDNVVILEYSLDEILKINALNQLLKYKYKWTVEACRIIISESWL
jgi:hypothetical protein